MTDNARPPFRLIILGAGFSRAAGVPLASELWSIVLKRARRFDETTRASKFLDDLEDYRAYLKACTGRDVAAEDVNFEDFMRFLDVEHFLRLRGGDTWSDDGNEGTIVVKTLIADTLSVFSGRRLPQLYLDFATLLKPMDWVITFNYDTVLEDALDAIGRPYRLFHTRYREIGRWSGTVDDKGDDDEVVILKMHGSIDWFDRANFSRREELNREAGAPPPTDIVFSNVERFNVKPLVDGPRFDHDPLRTVFRVNKVKALFEHDLMFFATPLMLAPSSYKLLYATRLGDQWDGMGLAGLFNSSLAVIGFSLPQQDEYARQILHSIFSNYQSRKWPETPSGTRRSPVALIDHFSSSSHRDTFKDRYRFVDWQKAALYEQGFDQRSLDLIFRG